MHLPPVRYGSENGSASLIESVVLSIRIEYATGTVTQADLGKRYRVTAVTIGYIVRGRTWKHVGGPITIHGRGGYHRARPLVPPPYKEGNPEAEPASADIEQRVRSLGLAAQAPP